MNIKNEVKEFHLYLETPYSVCTALPRVKFYRACAGCTAKEKKRRKRNRGYQGLLAVAQQPSPPLPPPPSHTPRAYWAAWDPLSGHKAPPPIVNRPISSDFQEKRLKSMIASF